MDLALWVAKSGLQAHHQNIAIISNNLANAANNGFKANRGEYTDTAYQMLTQPGASSTDQTRIPGGVMLGTGVKLVDNRKVFTQGPAQQTDRQLDIAIEGRGFLQVQVPNQSELMYTRAGSLQLNDQGQLVLHNGYQIQPPISLPQGVQNVMISENGLVSVTTSTGTSEQVGQLELVDFVNPSGLEAQGDNLYKETLVSGTPVTGAPTQNGLGTIRQHQLEASNVNVVEEMVNLIEAQRAFEMTSKVISAVDSMYQKLDRET